MRASSNWLEKFSLQINYGEGTVSSSSDIGTTPGIVPGEASNMPVLLTGCMVACTWKVIF